MYTYVSLLWEEGQIWRKVGGTHILVFFFFFLLCPQRRGLLLAIKLHQHPEMWDSPLMMPERPRCGEEDSEVISWVVSIAQRCCRSRCSILVQPQTQTGAAYPLTSLISRQCYQTILTDIKIIHGFVGGWYFTIKCKTIFKNNGIWVLSHIYSWKKNGITIFSYVKACLMPQVHENKVYFMQINNIWSGMSHFGLIFLRTDFTNVKNRTKHILYCLIIFNIL